MKYQILYTYNTGGSLAEYEDGFHSKECNSDELFYILKKEDQIYFIDFGNNLMYSHWSLKDFLVDPFLYVFINKIPPNNRGNNKIYKCQNLNFEYLEPSSKNSIFNNDVIQINYSNYIFKTEYK